MTPTCRERMAAGTYLRLTWRICPPTPGTSLGATRSAQKRGESPKQLPIRAWWMTVCALGMHGVDQGGKPCPVCGRALGAQPVERVVLSQQAFAPALEGVQPRFLGVRRIGPLRESRPNRRGVDVAHQAPDELQL